MNSPAADPRDMASTQSAPGATGRRTAQGIDVPFATFLGDVVKGAEARETVCAEGMRAAPLPGCNTAHHGKLGMRDVTSARQMSA